MNLWKYTPDSDHFQTLRLGDYRKDSPVILSDENLKRGRPLPEPFPVVSVTYEKDSKDLSPSQRRLARKGKLPRGDFPSLFGAEVIFSKGALDVLEPLIRSRAQIMPLLCVEDQLYLIHVTDVVDCLDRSQSEIVWVTGQAGAMAIRITHHVFHDDKLIGHSIFKVPELFTSTFVSDAFKKAVEEHNLQGLRWEPLP